MQSPKTTPATMTKK